MRWSLLLLLILAVPSAVADMHAVNVDIANGKIDSGYVFESSKQSHIVVDIPTQHTFSQKSFAFWFKSDVQGDRYVSFVDINRPGSFILAGNGRQQVLMAYMRDHDADIGMYAPGQWEWVIDGNWHHVVFSHRGGIISPQNTDYYLDGRDVTGYFDIGWETEGLTTQNISYTRHYFGCYGNLDKDTFLDGMMDDIRVYDIALTADDVALLYNEGKGTEKESVAASHLLVHLTGVEQGNVPAVKEEVSLLSRILCALREVIQLCNCTDK